jgi:hypothetical protein
MKMKLYWMGGGNIFACSGNKSFRAKVLLWIFATIIGFAEFVLSTGSSH